MKFKEVRVDPIVVLQTQEALKAVRDVAGEWVKREKTAVLVWDPVQGVRSYQDWSRGADGRNPNASPKAAIESLSQSTAETTIMIAIFFHTVWKNPQVFQALMDSTRLWSNTRKRFIIIAPPGAVVPTELERYVVVIDHDLPDEEALANIVRANTKANGIDLAEEEVRHLARVGRGLTSFQFANALMLSLVDHGTFNYRTVLEQKRQLVREGSALVISESDLTFADIGGLERVKEFLLATALHPEARGVLFLGVPGVGKTMMAEALANELRLPALKLEFSRVFGSLVGESEQRLHAALEVVEAMAPVVLIIDEIEKGLAGVQSSHRSDGGTAARVGGAFLTWLSDRPEKDGVYVVATSNDVSKLPPEYLREGRWDGVFFFDLPTDEEREAIARIHAKKYGLPVKPRPDKPGWTGSEIAGAYRKAHMMGLPVPKAAEYVVPLTRLMAEEIDALRKWARGRCIPASYSPSSVPADSAVRRVL